MVLKNRKAVFAFLENIQGQKPIKMKFYKLTKPVRRSDLFEKWLDNKIGDKWGVYAIFGIGNKCIYVGTGQPIRERLRQHNREASWPDENIKYHDTFKPYLQAENQDKLKVQVFECRDLDEYNVATDMGKSLRNCLEDSLKCILTPEYWNH